MPFTFSKTQQMSVVLLQQWKLSVTKKSLSFFHLEILNWLNFECRRFMRAYILCHANELFMSSTEMLLLWDPGKQEGKEWSRTVLCALSLSFIRKEALLGTLKTMFLW